MSTLSPKTLKTPPPRHEAHLLLSYPRPHILLLTLNRPKELNSLSRALRIDIGHVLDWFETEPDLWILIVTGAGRVFCAGGDLKPWTEDVMAGTAEGVGRVFKARQGIGSMSRRQSSKPWIAAVNGNGAFGGGAEALLNFDLVVASEKALFGFPEPQIGVVAAASGLERLVRAVGRQLAAELLLTGKSISAVEARDRFGFVNLVVPVDEVVPRAITLAESILENSPDAIRSTKRALSDSYLYGNIEEASRAHVISPESLAVFSGDNIKEGLAAYVEGRRPNWSNPKL
ncbi:hypothetical protein BS47DRAFT_1341795 [Hydnum rufescens UP504]|uniref:Enoyl-CoA hydratase n=1 Tax=Hydnum rufescens UP504 TaxID=1448309 RepID=A0A9P6B176_9AGAM|nr:hypothetical protein BS47DRAFT_1341795 [Hydnum rufescens UP504]